MIKEERKLKNCNGTGKRITKILRKSIESGDFQQKAESPVSQPQAEWWMSAAPGNVSNLPLKLGALKVWRGKGRPASCWASGGTNRDPFREDRSK